jgi:hypothetical protein
LKVDGLDFMVLGFRVKGSGFKVQVLEFRVWSLGFRVLGFRLGFGVQG